MTGPAPKPRRPKKVLLRALIGFGILALFILGAWYLTSAHFQEQVRRRVVAQLEQVTGGRVELKSFRWDLSRLEFEAHDLTIHGLEAPGEAPYMHVDRLLLRVRIISLFRRQIGLRYVGVERPRVHIIVYPDDTTNQPVPKAQPRGPSPGVQELFTLAINRVEVKDGELLWNQQRLPLDFSARSLAAELTYVPSDKRYDGHLQLGAMGFKYASYQPLASQTDLRFSLWTGHAELKSLDWRTKGSSLEAHGGVADYRNPRLELTYAASLDVRELGAIIHAPQLRAGRADLHGQGVYHARDFSSTGRLVLKQVDWVEDGLRVPNLTAAANYSVTRERLSLKDLVAQVFGGLIYGSADIQNWAALGPARPGARLRDAARQRGTARLRLDRVQVASLASAIATSRLPLDQVRAVGSTTGTVELAWAGSLSSADATISLTVEPPAQPAPEQLPVNARVEMLYHGAQRKFDISQFNLAARSTRLSAAGILGSESARLNLAVNTTDVGEIQHVLRAFHKPRLPLELRGHASFTGSVAGKLASPSVAGHLEAADFDTELEMTRLLPAATPPSAAPSRLHWDSLSANLQYSSAQLAVRNALLRRGPAHVSFDFQAGLRNGNFEDTSPLTLRAEVRNAELADVQALAGYHYPVTGKLSFNVSASGTRLSPHGDGSLQVLDGTLYGEHFNSLRAGLGFRGSDVQLTNLALSHNGAQITGTVAFNLSTQAFQFDLRGSNFELAKFRQLQRPRLTVAGQAEFRAQGSGTREAPVINAELHVHHLVLNSEETGDFDATAVTHGSDMRLTARSHFQTAELAIDGDIHLRGDFPANLTLRFAHLDVRPLLRAYLGSGVTGHSSLAGAVDLRGPLRRPRDLNLVGHLDQFSAEVQDVVVESEGPVRFTLANEFLTLDRLHLLGYDRKMAAAAGAQRVPTTDITAGGVVQLGGVRELNLRARGNLDLRLLPSFIPDLSSSGAMQVSLVVNGTVSRPEMSGHVEISNGSLSYVDLPNGLSDVNGSLVFDDNRLRVQSLTARSGGGTLKLGGYITYTNGLAFHLTASSRDIRLRYPEGVTTMASAELRYDGTPRNSTLSGDVTITKFGINPRFDFATYLARSKQPAAPPPPDSPLNNLHFDVHIVSAAELQVQMVLGKIAGTADLRLRGTATHPVLLGRVDIAEGDIVFAASKYHVERGEITFSNPVRIEPVLNIEATSRVRDYDIILGFHGPVDRLTTTYRSDPPLPEADIIALLALGRTREDVALYQQQAEPSTFAMSTSNAILGEALSAASTSRVQKLFGVSRIKIDPQVGGPETNPNARITIEQQVSDKVTLTFISNLAQSAQQIVQVEYNINKRLSIVGIRDQNGVLSFDVKYRQRKK